MGFNFLDPLDTGLDVGGLGDPSKIMGGGMGGLGGLFGGGGGGSSIFGSKPIVPDFVSTDAAKEQKLAIKGNLKSFKSASELAAKTNVFNREQLLKSLEASIPQYQAMMKAGSARSMDMLTNESFASMLRGEIPKDVQDQVQNSAAAQAIGGGYGGSQMHANLVARDFGLTSLDLIKRGQDATLRAVGSAEQWLANAKALSVPAQADVTSMFVSPAQRIANTQQNNAGQWTRDWLAAQVEAAPDPAARGAFDTAMGLTGMILSAYSGGPGYQNYYKSPYQGGTQSPMGGGGGGQPNAWNATNNTSYLPTNSAPSNIDYGYGAPSGYDPGAANNKDAMTSASFAGKIAGFI